MDKLQSLRDLRVTLSFCQLHVRYLDDLIHIDRYDRVGQEVPSAAYVCRRGGMNRVVMADTEFTHPYPCHNSYISGMIHVHRDDDPEVGVINDLALDDEILCCVLYIISSISLQLWKCDLIAIGEKMTLRISEQRADHLDETLVLSLDVDNPPEPLLLSKPFAFTLLP